LAETHLANEELYKAGLVVAFRPTTGSADPRYMVQTEGGAGVGHTICMEHQGQAIAVTKI
jgi:hypothetical protein